jgi:hypothetical protein
VQRKTSPFNRVVATRRIVARLVAGTAIVPQPVLGDGIDRWKRRAVLIAAAALTVVVNTRQQRRPSPASKYNPRRGRESPK